MPDRRFNEQEIAAIFEQATAAQEAASQRRPEHGLTLTELQEIGTATGIDPAYIQRAAQAVSHGGTAPPPTTFFGLPITAERTVALPGPLAESEWERLVVDLRQTFAATGKLERDGNLRSWHNGNLRAAVEPSPSGGYHLRLYTLKGSARQNLVSGLACLLMGFFMTPILLTSGKDIFPAMLAMMLVAALGVFFIGQTVYQTPRWAALREQQMTGLIARLLDRLDAAEATAAALPPTSTTPSPAEPEVSDAARLKLDETDEAAPTPATVRTAQRNRS